MNGKLVLTGVTGQKSGGVFLEHIASYIEEISAKFPGGITVACRESSNTSRLEDLLPQAIIKRGDLSDANFLQEAFAGADTIVHIAWIRFSRQVADAAAAVGARRLICVHTTGIYSKYKAAGEEYRHIDAYVEEKCKSFNISLTILRPTMIYGNTTDMNVTRFIRMVDRLPVMPVVNGARYELQPVHYKDLAQAYYSCLMNEATGNHNYSLSGGEVIQLRDMLKVIGDNLGKKVTFVSVPYPLAYAGAWCVYVASLGKVDYREKVQRLCEPRVYSHEDATRDFGYNPRTFREGVIGEVKEYLAKK